MFLSANLPNPRRCRGGLRAALAALLLAATPLSAVEPARLDPLPADAIGTGCGCSFYAAPQPRPQALVLRWNQDERQHGITRVDGQSRKLALGTEKHLPEQRPVPAYGDRLVLQFADDTYKLDVASSVKRACSKRAPTCKSTGYVARFILRRGTEQPVTTQGWGECGC